MCSVFNIILIAELLILEAYIWTTYVYLPVVITKKLSNSLNAIQKQTKILFKHQLLDCIINMRLVTWSGEIARIIVRLVRFPVIRVRVSHKARLVSVFKQYLYS